MSRENIFSCVSKYCHIWVCVPLNQNAALYLNFAKLLLSQTCGRSGTNSQIKTWAVCLFLGSIFGQVLADNTDVSMKIHHKDTDLFSNLTGNLDQYIFPLCIQKKMSKQPERTWKSQVWPSCAVYFPIHVWTHMGSQSIYSDETKMCWIIWFGLCIIKKMDVTDVLQGCPCRTIAFFLHAVTVTYTAHCQTVWIDLNISFI